MKRSGPASLASFDLARLLSRAKWLGAIARRYMGGADSTRWAEASYAVVIVTIGICGGLVGVLYQWALRLFQGLWFASSDSILEIAESLSWQRRLAAPAAGALLGALIVRYGLRKARPELVSDIMEAVALRNKMLSVREALWKGLGSLAAIGSGNSIGREGPMAQICAAAGGRLAEFTRIPADRRRILIGCGVASGMAAAYGAPIGASLFVMEVIIGNFAMEVFGPLVIASVVATLMTRGVVGGPIYQAPGFALTSAWEFIPYVLLGVACAVVGRVFIAALSASGWFFGRLPLPSWGRAALGGLGVGAIAIWVPYVWGNGYEGVDRALRGELPVELLGWALAGKLVATALSLGSGSAGGAFTPTIFLGATLGGMIGTVTHTLWPAFTSAPGAYALVGMSGLLAATTHAPIMSTLIVFEMSLDYNLILPVMVCAGVSALLSRAMRRDSIYTERLRKRGVDIDLAIEETALQAIHCKEVMWTSPPTVRPHAPLRALLDKFLHMRGGESIHVVAEDGKYAGVIAVHDLVAAADQKDVAELLIADDLARMVPHVKASDPVSIVMERFWFQEHGELPVLADDPPHLFLGVVTRRDVLRAFDREVLQRKMLTARYTPGETVDAAATTARAGRLPPDFAVEEVPIPGSLVGQSLIELDLPRRFLLTALALKPASGDQAEIIPPPVDRRLAEGDRLVLAGKRQDLARFARA